MVLRGDWTGEDGLLPSDALPDLFCIGLSVELKLLYVKYPNNSEHWQKHELSREQTCSLLTQMKTLKNNGHANR